MTLHLRSPLGPGYGYGRRLDVGVDCVSRPSIWWCSDSRWKWLPYPVASLIGRTMNRYYCRAYGHDWRPHHAGYGVHRYLYHFCIRCARREYRAGLRDDWPIGVAS